MRAMTARERAVDRARRRSARQLAMLAQELRDARLGAGRTQTDIAKAAGISSSELSRIELGRPVALQFETIAIIGALVGLDVSIRSYPGDHLLRDEAQLRLLRALRERLGPAWAWRHEVPVAPGDQRAWDAVGRHRRTGILVAVEAETRIRDAQALLRRMNAKREAADSPRMLLVVADTRHDRAALRAALDGFATEFPVGTRSSLRALTDGRDPGADCLVVLRPWSSPRPLAAPTSRADSRGSTAR